MEHFPTPKRKFLISQPFVASLRYHYFSLGVCRTPLQTKNLQRDTLFPFVFLQRSVYYMIQLLVLITYSVMLYWFSNVNYT